MGIVSRGSFQKTESFLDKMKRRIHLSELDSYGQRGVIALASATPVDSGLTDRPHGVGRGADHVQGVPGLRGLTDTPLSP